MKAKHKPMYKSVPLPQSGVSVTTSGKYKYVYHIGRGYRNSKGQPTNDKTGIGKLDENGMLIPNENYFAIYGGTPQSEPEAVEVDSILNFGDHFLLDHIAENIGLKKVMKNIFGELGDDVLLLAIYMSLTGNALYRSDSWCRETLTGRGKAITSQHCSRVLEKLDEKSRMSFFSAWANAREQQEYLAYDVTSISSYARGIDLVEYGYNRDNERLPQMNLGMYYGEESKLPIFYCTYKGSIVDKSHLPYMMRYNKVLGIKNVSFVMDRGFFSEDNVKEMAHKHRFIVGLSNSLKLSKEMISKHGQQVMSSRYDIGLTGVKGLAIDDDRYDFRSKIHLFYANIKIAEEERLFKDKLAAWEEELNDGVSLKIAEDYFTVAEDKDGTNRAVERNYDAIDEKIRNMGYFLMLTTDLSKTPDEVLDIYRRKDIIEKCFDELKNDLDMRRLRVHSSVAAEGKMFIAFIGLILRTYVHNKLRNYFDTNRAMSMPQVFDEMRMIKTVKTKDGMLLYNPITKKQRTILEQFGIDEEVISKAIHKYAKTNPFFFE